MPKLTDHVQKHYFYYSKSILICAKVVWNGKNSKYTNYFGTDLKHRISCSRIVTWCDMTCFASPDRFVFCFFPNMALWTVWVADSWPRVLYYPQSKSNMLENNPKGMNHENLKFKLFQSRNRLKQSNYSK